MKLEQATGQQLDRTSFKRSDLEAVGIKPDKLDILQFDNIRQFAGYLKTLDGVVTPQKESEKGSMSFTGTNTYQEALDLILKPYGEPPAKIKTKVEDIECKIRNNLHKKGLLTDWISEDYHYDVEGVEIDIAKLVEGDPECYLKPNKKYKDCFYDLNVNVAVSYSNTTVEIIDAFCKVIAVVVALEKRGHKIRLFATSVTKDASKEGRSSLINVCIKKYDEFVDIKAIARIIYPSYLRRLIFKVEEVKYMDKLSYGYGLAVKGLKGCVTLDRSLNEEELLNKIVAEQIAK